MLQDVEDLCSKFPVSREKVAADLQKWIVRARTGALSDLQPEVDKMTGKNVNARSIRQTLKTCLCGSTIVL